MGKHEICKLNNEKPRHISIGLFKFAVYERIRIFRKYFELNKQNILKKFSFQLSFFG